ncbi:hypothetical protein ACKWTF_015772 [Chironomus riparius]
MDQLPEDILIEIFLHLDNESMLNVMKTCTLFCNVFSTSSKLLLKFNLKVTPKNVNHLSALLDVPFKNITISDINTDDDLAQIHNFVKKFGNFVEIMNFKNIYIHNFELFLKVFGNFSNLKELIIEEGTVAASETGSIPLLPSLRSLTFEECCQNIFKLFVQQSAVKKVKFYRNKISNTRYLFDNFLLMTAAMPNLNHAIINGFAASLFFNSDNFTFKVQKFEATLLTGWWSVTVPRLNFLKSQQGVLKELTVHRLPYDDDGHDVLKFIIEEMKLDKFYLRKIPLILDGKKQEVKKLTVSEYEICSMFEMFRQYPIQYLRLMLTHTHIDEPAGCQVINPDTDLFEDLQSLEVVDGSMQLYNFPRFLGLYKNCRNIKKLSISTNDDNINFVLRQCLPEMTQLIEVNLNVDVKKDLVMDMLEVVRKYVRNIEKFGIIGIFAEDARKVFIENVQIIAI